jgi:hypothetical protein
MVDVASVQKACKWHVIIVCTHKVPVHDDMVLQACRVVFYPICTAVAQPL